MTADTHPTGDHTPMFAEMPTARASETAAANDAAAAMRYLVRRGQGELGEMLGIAS